MDSLSMDTIFQSVSILVALTTFFISNLINKIKDRKLARKEIYLSLEYASIDLFRFEAENIELIRPVWQKDILIPKRGTAEYEVLVNYLCQMLNLFELAISFRGNKTMPHDVFGSWVDWYYKLAKAPGFLILWPDIRVNYVEQLRKILDYAVLENPGGNKREFFIFVSTLLGNCPVIRNWPIDEPNPKIQQELNNLKIEWLTNDSDITVNDLVAFFINNTTEKYISHTEILEGRAINEWEWSPNVKNILAKEFASNLGMGRIAVARRQNELIGLMFLEWPHKEWCTLSDIVVKQSLQKNQVGSQMVNWLKNEVDKKGGIHILAESGSSNVAAHSFLEKNGFQKLSYIFKFDLESTSKYF